MHESNRIELMRVFRDLDIVEHMGSVIPRILEHYPQSIYHITRNFIRVVLPFGKGFEQTTEQATEQVTAQATGQVPGQVKKCLQFCEIPRSTKEIMQHLGLSHRESFRDTILLPLIESGKIALTSVWQRTFDFKNFAPIF